MISPETRKQYVATIGIECHVQLKTKTKLFAAVDNDARTAPPNTLISHICLGMPGALPVLNKEAVHLSSRMAFALNTEPQSVSRFDRKHYFYPDLPKGYQITQYDQPIISGGHVDINVNGGIKRVGITRAHLEEDAGKNTHPGGKDYSLVDLNRAGTPLLEIVSEPDMHSPIEAKAYARELYLLVRYAGVSDADLFQGNMRFDVNVSVSKHAHALGARTETKNLNSFRSVEKAAEFEINRQIELLEKGHKIIQETRGWDDAKQKTFSQRGKEEAHDYRYMPEPDIPPVELASDYIDSVRSEMPVLPNEWRERLGRLELEPSQIELLLDADIEDERISYLGLIAEHQGSTDFGKVLANWFVNIEIPLRRAGKGNNDLKDSSRNELYVQIYELVKAGEISSTAAKNMLRELLRQTTLPESIQQYASDHGYLQLSDESDIAALVQRVIDGNPSAVADIRSGQEKAVGYLVGEVMKLSNGKANPSVAQRLLKQQLNS